jgi:hypothetical protein
MDSESAPTNEPNLGKQRNRPDVTRKVEEFHAAVIEIKLKVQQSCHPYIR